MIKQLHNKHIVYVKLVDTNVQIGINTSVTSIIVISNRLVSKKFKRCFHMYNHNMPSATEPHMENSNKIPR